MPLKEARWALPAPERQSAAVFSRPVARLILVVLMLSLSFGLRAAWAQDDEAVLRDIFASGAEEAKGRQDYKEAERLYRAAIAEAEKVRGQYDEWLRLIGGLTELYTRQGRLGEAEQLVARASETVEQQAPSRGDLRGRLLYDRALIAARQSRYGEAAGNLEEALKAWQEAGETGQASVAACLHALGIVTSKLGDKARAEELLKEALTVYDRTSGDQSAEFIGGLCDLSLIDVEQGKLPSAELLARRAVELGERVYGKSRRATGAGLYALATALKAQGKLAESAPVFEQALAACDQSKAGAGTALDRGKVSGPGPADATAPGEDALAAIAGRGELAAIFRDYAQVLRALDRPDQARQLEIRARAVEKRQAGSR